MKISKYIIIPFFAINLAFSFPLGLIALSSALTCFTISSVEYLLCKFSECCRPKWINNDISGLQTSLHEKLYGQPLVSKLVGKYLKDYIETKTDFKPLVLSFNGGPGTGKTYASKIIATFLFKNGLQSKYVHRYIATKDFKNPQKFTEYKRMVFQSIKANQANCSQALYIFDEVHLMPHGLMKAILNIFNNIKYSLYWERKGLPLKTIVILLSNTGMHKIKEWTRKNIINGVKEGSLSSDEVKMSLEKSDFLEIDDNYDVDSFIPFYPLEKEQIKLCIQDEFKQMKRFYDDALINHVLNMLDWYPAGGKLFASSGCKNVQAKISLLKF